MLRAGIDDQIDWGGSDGTPAGPAGRCIGRKGKVVCAPHRVQMRWRVHPSPHRHFNAAKRTFPENVQLRNEEARSNQALIVLLESFVLPELKIYSWNGQGPLASVLYTANFALFIHVGRRLAGATIARKRRTCFISGICFLYMEKGKGFLRFLPYLGYICQVEDPDVVGRFGGLAFRPSGIP